ncbi:MAG: hypothetical protein ACM30H_03975 [Clostridia bacterium]
MRRCLFLLGLLVLADAHAFEILALGTSATNCKGVARDKIYPVRLQEMLRSEGVSVTVVNGGDDGDTPAFMIRRLPKLLDPQTRLVIFEPGPNDPDPASSRESSARILEYLRERNLPTIYISTGRIQSVDEARQMATQYGAYYYGHYGKNVPLDRAHYQFDFAGDGKGRGGHMTAEGCFLVAKNLVPLVMQVIKEKDIH